MKTRWLKKFIRKANDVKMTAHEKRVMLSRILGPSGIPSPYSFFLTVMEYRQRIVVAAVIVAFVLTSGGTSFAAASALPGEALYSIKVNVNEEIQSFVAVSADAKVKVEVKRAEKRLEEAETLSKTGRLNAKTQAIIEDNIEKHSETIKENIATLASENATATVKEVIEGLSNSIEAHEVALNIIASSSVSSSTDKSIDSILTVVNAVKNEIETIGADVATAAGEASSTATTTPSGTASTTSELPADIIEPTATSTATTTLSASSSVSIKPTDLSDIL